MHGCSPESVLLVNAEVDSMGGVIDGGVGIDDKTSPRRAAIEKAQAELRIEYDVREERRRELEFLEKGGNPLDFKLGSATSISIQSTSFTDQFVTSEVKDSFPCIGSPHGDSVESSGRPGAPSGRETNSADNLLLYDGENDEVERNSSHRNRSNITPSEQFSQLDGCNNVKESDDSAMFRLVVKSQAYARRNRSRSGRDSARVSSNELASAGDGNGSSILPSSRHCSRDAKGSLCEANTQKETGSSVCNSKSACPNGNLVIKNVISDSHLDRDLDVPQVHGPTYGLTKVGGGGSEVTSSKDLLGGEHILRPQDNEGQVPNATASEATVVEGRQDGLLPGLDGMPGAASATMDNISNVGQTNGFGISQIEGKAISKEGQCSTAAFNRKDSIDSESSSIHISHELDRNTSNDQCLSLRKLNSHGNSKRQASEIEEAPDGAVVEMIKGNNEAKDVGVLTIGNGEEDIYDNKCGAKNEMNPLILKAMEHNDPIVSQSAGKLDNLTGDSSNLRKAGSCHEGRALSITNSSHCELLEVNRSGRISTAAPELQTCTESQLKVANKAHEDSILEEARSIEAKRKRIAELSVGSFPLEYRRKSHWDFVLEEMAWLANDFTQERVWKTTAAAQVSRCAALNARSRFDKQNLFQKQKKIAYTLAKAIRQFWRSADILLNSEDPSIGLKNSNLTVVRPHKVDEGDDIKEKSQYFEKQDSGKNPQLAVQGYAVRFLKYSGSLDCSIEAEAPVTPDRISDSGVVDISCEDQFSGETLFYMVPPGAMEDYRKSVEYYWSQYEKTGGSTVQEEVDTSTYDNAQEFGSREYSYEEDEREMGSYYVPGAFEGSKPAKFTQKKRKGVPNSYARSYEVGADLPYGHRQFNENKVGTQSSSLMGKRSSNSLNVGSIPTKRVRTAAARQRVLSPFGAGGAQMTSKTEASSGDTSSFQDDQSTILGGSQIRKSLEVESTGEFGRQTPFDCTEVSTKPKKKKKPKHMVYKNSLNSTDTGGFVIGKLQGSVYEQRWQLDCMVQNEQREFSKKRLENHALESNGNTGLFGQHAAKRPKIMKQLHDTSPESITPMNGSIPSPVASQMSNMSNPNKIMKMIAGRDRGRKSKGLKMPAGQSGSGSQWSLFEDQALVVLVHDMGPNWELVSDAINSALQFKCIFRKPKECKERHKLLMDKNVGDGADSAEDSGSSQPYPSTLPGIPKGSARQLFQRLQGPMEEDALKSHFEKIILIGQKLHSCRNKNDNQDQKQITPEHNSHVVALSHAYPNNLNGVTLLPRDLCDPTTSNSDNLSLGCQTSQNIGLTIQSQGSLAPALPTSGANSLLPGSSGMVLSNSLPSPSSALNSLTRDGQRHNVPRPLSLPIDEHQKLQRYNQMLSGRNIQHSSLTAPGSLANDRGVRILPGGSGMGMMSGMNRGMLPRPGYQGMGSPAMLNMVSSGSMLSSSVAGIPSPANMHNGTVSGQGNPMMRTREALHMMRNPEDQRQMMMQELQMQATQGNSQSIPAFNGLSTGFSNQTVLPPVQTFPVQQQQQMAPHHPHLHGSNHAPNSQQQAYMLCLAKERQLQQRILHHQQQQQHHQFAASSASMHHAQPQSQHPISSPLPNAAQIQQQASPQPVLLSSSSSQHPLTSSTSPMIPTSSQPHQKHHLPPNGLGRNMQASSGSLPNQMLKQRQRQQQQLQQPSRQHPQQRPQLLSQQQAKVMKGMGRGNVMMQQNLPTDPSSVNGLTPTTPGNQAAEKSEQSMHRMPAQGVFSSSGLTTVHSGKSSVHSQPSNQCSPQQKMLPRSPSPSSKQLPQVTSHQENSNQGQISPASSGQTSLLTPHQPGLPLAVASQQQPQQQAQQRQLGQSQQTSLRMLQQNCQVNSDAPVQSSVDNVQVNHQPLNSAFQMATSMAPSQCCGESTSVIPAVSSASVHPHWKSPDPLFDPSTPNSTAHLASIRNPTLPSPVGGEPLPLQGQGLTQRQLSDSIPMHGHNVGTQWQAPAQQQKLQPLPPSQQSPPPVALQRQSPPSQQPQPPQQHFQSGQGGSYARPSNSESG